MTDCQPTDTAKRIIRAMAKAKVEAGMTDAHDIVDAIHAAIAEHTPLSKPEIADIVSGYGVKRQATRTELSERLSQLRRDLKASFHPDAPAAAKNAARQRAIKAEIARINEQIAKGDFSKAPARPKFAYDETTQKMQADLMHARHAADLAKQRIAYKAQPRVYRALSFMSALGRASVLFGTGVFKHLFGASAWRLVSTLAEDVAGAGMRFMLPEIDRLAKVEGGGFGAGGHIAGLKGAFSKQTIKDMWDKLAKGASDRQMLYGHTHEMNHPWLEMVGKLHDAIKTPIENYAFGRAYWRQSQNMGRELTRLGKTPDQIDKIMALDSTHAALSLRAYEESLAAKLQGKNKLADAITGKIGAMEQSNHPYSRLGAAFLRQNMPIVKIPINLARETVEYALGGFIAGGKAIEAARAVKMGERAIAFTPEDADYILRAIKKNAVGLALIGVGYSQYQHFGGLWRNAHAAPNKNLKYGDVSFDGKTVEHHWLHAAPWSLMQAAALFHYVQDEDEAKARKEHDYGNHTTRDAIDGLAQVSGSIALDLPFAGTARGMIEGAGGGKGLQHYLGGLGRQYIPQGVQQYAREHDLDARGEPVTRKPQTYAQEIEEGIPGHGFDTPFGRVPGRLDVPDHNPTHKRSQE